VAAVLADYTRAPISEQLRGTLGLLQKVTRAYATVTVDDVKVVRALGVTRAQVEDALAVAFAFNTITRLADTFAFPIPEQEGFDMSAKMLLKRGYNL